MIVITQRESCIISQAAGDIKRLLLVVGDVEIHAIAVESLLVLLELEAGVTMDTVETG